MEGGGPREGAPRPRTRRGREPAARSRRPSNCPNWIPQGDVRAKTRPRSLKSRRTLTWPPQEEVTRCRSRLERGGYRCAGVPPIASRIVVANGQLPTDSCGAVRLDCSSERASGVPAALPRGQPPERRRPGRARREQESSSTRGVTARWQYLVTRGPTNDGADVNILKANGRGSPPRRPPLRTRRRPCFRARPGRET